MATDQMQKAANGKWPTYEIEITESGFTPSYSFATENTFVDSNIVVRAHADAAGEITLNLNDLTTAIDMGDATNGLYKPVVSLNGKINIGSAGWITSGEKQVADNQVKIGTVAQSTLSNGNTAISSGAVITPGSANQTINISAGYNAARTIIVGAISSTSEAATIKSGNATLGKLTYTYDGDNARFNITGTATISAATAEVAGFISATEGTKQGNSNQVTQTVNVITVGSEIVGSFTKAKPVIVRTAQSGGSWIDAGTGNATETPSANTPYVQVDAAAVSATLQTKGKVTEDGYGTTSNFQLAANTSYEVGSQAAETMYIPIKIGTIKSPDIDITSKLSSPTYYSTGANAGKFTIAIDDEIAAPSSTKPGYISSVVGTKNKGSITGTKVLNKIKVGTNVTGNTTLTHQLTKGSVGANETWINGASSDNAVTSTPSSGVYIKVNAAELKTTISSVGKVVTAGYGTTTSGQFTADTPTDTTIQAAAMNLFIPVQEADGYNLSIANSTGISGSSDISISNSVDANNKYTVIASNLTVRGTFSVSTSGWFTSGTASDTDVDSCTVGKISAATFVKSGATVSCATGGYVPAGALPQNGTIGNATFAKVATENVSYVDYSDEAPILDSNGYLYINEGYTPNRKISLAKLVPDSATKPNNVTYDSGLRENFALYDENGVLVTGTIKTYDGRINIS